MKLFKFIDHDLTLEDEALALPVFMNVYKKHDKDMGSAMDEFKYIFFMVDYRSDFDDILDLSVRHTKVIEQVIGHDNLVIDKITNAAMELYEERQQTASLHLLTDAKYAVGKVQHYLRHVDLDLTDGNGKPIHDIKKLTDTLTATPKLVTALSELEAQVKREMTEVSRIRGGGQLGFFEH